VTGTKPPESIDVRDLRAVGLRVTAPRLAVLAAVREGGHLTVEEIALLGRRRLGAVSTQAVYDVLHALTAAGLIRRIEPAWQSGAL
jgi:Fe2+ or Zn2+ uptake regulation protein